MIDLPRLAGRHRVTKGQMGTCGHQPEGRGSKRCAAILPLHSIPWQRQVPITNPTPTVRYRSHSHLGGASLLIYAHKVERRPLASSGGEPIQVAAHRPWLGRGGQPSTFMSATRVT